VAAHEAQPNGNLLGFGALSAHDVHGPLRESRRSLNSASVGIAFGDGQAAMPGPHFREAPLRSLQGGLAADPRDLAEHTPIIEPLSLAKPIWMSLGIPLARELALAIRAKIKEATAERFGGHLLQ
jgi:hypothetical protein